MEDKRRSKLSAETCCHSSVLASELVRPVEKKKKRENEYLAMTIMVVNKRVEYFMVD